MAICEICFEGRGYAIRQGRRVCKSCREWWDYWTNLTPEQQERELESMSRYVEESEHV